MKFEPKQARAVMRGKKTEHRIPSPCARGTERPNAPCSTPRGFPITVRVDGEPEPLGHVEVTEIRRQRLLDVTDSEAQREGYADRAALLEAFKPKPTSTISPKRFVWVLTLRPALPLRLLHKNSSLGYTQSKRKALEDVPAVDADVQDELTKRSHARSDVLRAEEKHREEIRRLSAQLRDVTVFAGRRGLDPAPLLETMKAQLVAFERKAERKRAA